MSLLSTMRTTMTALVVLLTLLCLGSSQELNQTVETTELADNNTNFAFDLYHTIRELQNGSEENIFFSPWSISQCLAMTYAGASGDTKIQMADVLHFNDDEDFHLKFKKLKDDAFNQPPGAYTFKQANKIFGATGYTFKEGFLNMLQNLYQSPLEMKDFYRLPELSRLEINYWVEQQTEDKIKDLLPEGSVTDRTVLMLVNALYFKAKWKTPFKQEEVKSGNFYTQKISGSEDEYVTVDMMVQKSTFAMYAHNTVANYKMLELPYSGSHVSMFIVLPDGRFDINSVTAYMSADNIRGDMGYLEKTLLNIHLPKFKIRATFKLKNALQQLGMTDAFSDAAEFREMTDGPVKLSDVYHQAFIDVNEEGTEAAAGTGTGVISRSGRVIPEEFKVDHPFLFFIRENKTGSILFMGKIGNPKAS